MVASTLPVTMEDMRSKPTSIISTLEGSTPLFCMMLRTSASLSSVPA